MNELPEHLWEYIYELGHKRDQGEVLLELEVKHEFMQLWDMVTGLKREDRRGRTIRYRPFGIVMDAEEVARRCKTEQPSKRVKWIVRELVKDDGCAKEQLALVREKVDKGGSPYWFEWRDIMQRYNYLYTH